jgi:integrase
MSRPTLPLGSYGKITTWQTDAGYTSRTKFRDFDGVVRPVKRNGKTKTAAERALKAALVERQAPTNDADIKRDSTFGKAADLWFVELEGLVRAGQRSPGTLKTYRSIYKTHVKAAFASLRVSEVSTPVADRALSAIARTSTSAARTAKIVVSGIMGLAARHGAIVVNPVREVGRIEGTPARLPRALSAEEREQWLKAVGASKQARDWDLPDLSLMMLATGCRIGECLAIGWTEIDLDGACVDIAWHLVRATGVGLLRLPATKSGPKGERVLPLPGWAVTMLKRRRLLIGADVEPVFPDSLGGWRDPSNVGRVWREVRRKAEMTDMVSHHLRKTVASFLDDANVSTRKISDQLGHANVSMTQDRYLGRRITDRQTAEVLDGMFEDPVENDLEEQPEVEEPGEADQG